MHTKYFLPRDHNLQDIIDVLLPSKEVKQSPPDLRTFVITGIGGVGKTELAREFVISQGNQYDAIFFFTADQKTRLLNQFSEAAIMLGLANPDSWKEVDFNTYTLKTWLEHPVKYLSDSRGSEVTDLARWLVIFDNADDLSFLKDFWPATGHGSIIATSRNPFMRSAFFQPNADIQLVGLGVNDASQLLTHLSGFNSNLKTEQEALSTIVEQLDGLPLAIEQIGAILCRQSMSFTSFLDTYGYRSLLYKLYNRTTTLGYGQNLGTTWAFDSLSSRSLDLLSIISMLDPETIQEQLLLLALNISTNYVSSTVKADYHECLSNLVETSMVQKNPIDGSVRVHRLVQDVLRARLVKDKQKLLTVFKSVLNAVSTIWFESGGLQTSTTGTSGKVSRWDRCATNFPHVVKLGVVYREVVDTIGTTDAGNYIAKLLAEATWYQYERGEGPEATPLLELATEILEQSNVDATDLRKRIYGCRIGIAGTLCDATTFYRYCQLRLQMAETESSKLGKPTSFLATAQCEMGQAYSMNRLSEKGISLLHTSCSTREQLPNYRKDWLFNPLMHLSLAYYCLDEFDEAAKYVLKAINDRIEVLGPNDRDSIRTGALYYVLGNIRNRQGLSDDAYGWHQKALLHCRQTAGETILATLRCEYKVAEHYVRYGWDKQAKPPLQLIIGVCGSRESRHREVAQASYLLSGILDREGEVVEQKIALERALEIFNISFPESPRTLDSLTREDMDSLVYYDFL